MHFDQVTPVLLDFCFRAIFTLKELDSKNCSGHTKEQILIKNSIIHKHLKLSSDYVLLFTLMSDEGYASLVLN